MAGKARRVASRQAQLSRKRKRQQKGVAAPASTVETPVEVDGQHTATASPRVVEPTTPDPAPASAPVPDSPVAAPPSRSAPVPRAPGRTRGERPAAYNYIGAELRRILFLAITVLVIIIVLGFLI